MCGHQTLTLLDGRSTQSDRTKQSRNWRLQPLPTAGAISNTEVTMNEIIVALITGGITLVGVLIGQNVGDFWYQIT